MHSIGTHRYYRIFVHGYAQITAPLENLLKKDTKFVWIEKCQKYFDELKDKLATTPILVFSYWSRELCVHVDASSIVLGIVQAQSGEGQFDHPIYFSSRKLSTTKENYITLEKEGLAMLHSMQKYQHYLLGSHFKLFIDHSALKYIVNKLVLRKRVCKWVLLFQAYDFILL